MIMGVLLTMKQNGAFSNPIYMPYIKEGGSKYVYSNNKWLPGMREGRNAPKFITVGGRANKKWFFDDTTKKSWYGKWINKYLPVMHNEDSCEQVLKVILEELTNAEVLSKFDGPDTVKAWGISYDRAIVSHDVSQLVCDVCGNRITVSEKNKHNSIGMCCLRTACGGHYIEDEYKGLDFYGKLYSNGEMVRIVAREHTGLLDKEPREELERSFKKKKGTQNPWDANLLSCTPTLEMGIDIGDLSTVIMCSIPPGEAQYVQRAGRGGRTDGNALVIAVANARPHDLYFYEEPTDMISGSVEPPRVFLRATSVLARQFVAYCMDSWVKSGIAVIPQNVGNILSSFDSKDKNRFPYNYLNYIQDNLSKLLRTFIQTFNASARGEDGLDEDAKKELKYFAMGNGKEEAPMHMKILEEFKTVKAHRNAIQNNIDELNTLIKDLQAKPEDSSYEEEIKELKGQAAALARVKQSINEKNTFEFMSDQGLLPNYAFPESGIVLKAILFRTDISDDGEKKKGEKYTYEYNRAASTAISEFAPLNSFYAGGMKLNIDQVDINTTKIEKWRLCPSCSHAELEKLNVPHIACDKCGSPGWGDAGQVRSMLKVQMVYSNMRYKDSISNDDSDDRTTKFYNKEMLVDVDEDKDIDPAYSMDNSEFPFGYEFVKKATMREINFGEKDLTGTKLFVAGEEAVRKGFTVCKFCGKIQNGSKPIHTKYCKVVKENKNNPTPEDYDECLFLYREFQTEAIRLLVPSTTMDTSSVRLESFVAAFMLGMKKKFGNIDHLRACVSEVPVHDADYRKQYLVIYDSVPGGTGYLRQLMNENNGMIDILEKAVDAMENCSCNDDPNKDGCYKCLYAYRQSQHIGEISRKAALSMFKTILTGKNNRQKIKNLSLIDTNSLFDSELERRFIEALDRLGSAERQVEVTKKLVNEKEGYSLRIGDSVWDIEPQVELGKSNDVSVKCKPDFIFYPVRVTGNQKPVAVFTDGFTFHKNKVADDFLKRMAIMRSGKYRVWSLSYNDVQNVFQSRGDYKTETWSYDKLPNGTAKYMSFVKNLSAEELHPEKKDSFELLIDYLSNGESERLFSAHSKTFAFTMLDYSAMSNQSAYDNNVEFWDTAYAKMNSAKRAYAYGKAIFGMWEPRPTLGNLWVYSMLSLDDKDKKMNAPIRVMAVLNDSDDRTDKYDKDWNGFLKFSNLMQFCDDSLFFTRLGLNNSIYTVLNDETSSADVDSTPGMTVNEFSDAWDEKYEELFDDIEKACADEMIKNGIPAPDVIGYELEQSSNGAVIGEASMAWTDKKIALLLPEQEEYKDTFIKEGWKVILSSESITKDVFGGENNG